MDNYGYDKKDWKQNEDYKWVLVTNIKIWANYRIDLNCSLKYIILIFQTTSTYYHFNDSVCNVVRLQSIVKIR